MNTKRKLLMLSIVAVLIIAGASQALAAGRSEPAAAAGPVTMNYHIPGDPTIIDPSANWIGEVGANFFTPLIGFDANANEIYPRGATSWTVSDDGTVWTFDIRRDWLWSDGTPLTAADYEYGFQAIVDPETASPTAFRLSVIENAQAVTNGSMPVDQLGVRALDDHTLQITLEAPASWFLVSLSSIGYALPRWVREEYGTEWTNPETIVVNGPYTLASRRVDDVYVLEKNPNYYDADNVQIERINLIVVPQQSTAMAMYENGELDTVMVPIEDLDRVQRDPVLSQEFTSFPRLISQFYWFNVGRAPFDDVLVRRAFAAAVDKDTLVSRITRGGEVATDTIAPPGVVGYVDPSLGVGISYDPAQARAWLAEAGYPGGQGFPAVTVGFNFNEFNASVAQALQSMWQTNLGVEVTLSGVEGGAYGSLTSGGEFNIYRWGWGMAYPDANYIHEGIFHSKVMSETERTHRYHSDEFDRLIDEAATATDQAQREALYLQAERLLVEEDMGIIPMFFPADNRVTKPYLNRVQGPLMVQEFWNWTITQ
ncbi:MAG: peptide ABC transporter substrate-binding protein [Spirochaetaceae bacterium]|nr:MAG: peptide ABC transporter substrate-binding protein [Spirochaetaceae bacterium]